MQCHCLSYKSLPGYRGSIGLFSGTTEPFYIRYELLLAERPAQ